MDKYIVKTPCGEVKGTDCRLDGVVAFKGIRYATAKRWAYPEQVTHWDGIYNATEYGNCAYQPRTFENEAENPNKKFYYKEFRQGMEYTYSEDCLFLNIWKPEDAKEGDNLPILFYIHGGGYTGGCAHEKHFDDPVWAQKGVIAVSIHYRLGPLGFITLPELKEEAGHTGNYGLFDQLCALKWVRDNISAFGGDPEAITIMGQSAGSMSVQQHCLSPLSKGLFRGAVMCSGGGVHKILSASPAEKMYDFWHAVMKNCGVNTLEEFRAVEIPKLFEVWKATQKELKKPASSFPCIDGEFVVGTGCEIFAKGGQHDIHYMSGSTSHDMMPPFMYSMAEKWCEGQKKNSYAWFFDRILPGETLGAWHSADLWYWFDTLDNGWRPWTQKDRKLAALMSDYLVNFVKTGDPNGEGLPTWETAQKSKKAIFLGEGEPRMSKPSTLKLYHTMLTNKNVGF